MNGSMRERAEGRRRRAVIVARADVRAAVRVLTAILGPLLVAGGCGTTFGGGKEKPAPRVWSQETGWVELPRGESSPTAAALRAEARKAFEAGAYKDALDGLRAMQRQFPGSTEADDAQTHFLAGECLLKLGDYEDAYEEYDKALERGARGDLLALALNRIYHIGISFVQGKAKRHFAGIAYASPSFGVDILIGEKGIFTRYASLEYADDAYLEIARHYLEKRQYPEAERVYERLIRDYPRSEWTELARFKLAVTVFKQVRGVEYDQTPLKKAKRLFNVYRNSFPRGVHIEKVREYLATISEMEAQHDLEVARYYLRESRPDAALYYLEEIIRDNPKTDAAREAREVYAQMKNFRRRIEVGEGDSEAGGGA